MVLMAVAPATAPASNAPAETIQFVKYAQLQPDGSALVSLYYSCSPNAFGNPGFLAVVLEQPGAEGFAEEIEAQCDGGKHKATLDVGPGPFKPGPATVGAALGNGGSVEEEKFADIMIK